MENNVVWLSETDRCDVALAGGKGANLGEMIRAGFPVPPGFVVTAPACAAFFRETGAAGLAAGLSRAELGEAKEGAARIRRIIEEAEMPAGLTAEIMAAHRELTRQRGAEIVCAVRSSATAEDLGEASFAGQHETYYYVTADRLLDMIRHCWASLWSPEAFSYRRTQGIDHAEVFMAVVVQEMILSDVSGVTFTANPVTGDRDEVVTEASWGMGAAIVDGRVTPDHFVFARAGRKLKEKRIADKKYLVSPRLEPGCQARLEEVSAGWRRKESLTNDQIRLVSEWAVKAEQHFGSPQDVEWALSGGSFYLLQSRPITAMGRVDPAEGVEGKYVIFKPLVENFTDPLTPLTSEMFRTAFAPPLFRMVRGWLYVDLKNFRRLVPFKLTDQEAARLLYGFDALGPDLKLSWLKLPFMFLGFILTYLCTGVFFARTWNIPGDFMDMFREHCRQVEEDPDLGLVDTFLHLFGWRKLFDPVGVQVVLVNLSAPRYFFWLAWLQKLLKRWAPGVRQDAEALLSSGAEGVLSAEMGRGIWELAKTARAENKVREILEANPPDKVLAILKAEPQARGFVAQLEKFLEINGHRGLKELEAASPRWAEDPAPVLGMVRNYLLVDVDADLHYEALKKSRRELEDELKRRFESLPQEKFFHPRWRLMRYVARQARYFSRMRENSRFYHILGFNVLRRKILKIESQLLENGRLRCRGDVFFLRKAELDRLISGELGWLDVEDRIRERRMEHIRLSKITPPKTIGIELHRPEAEKVVEDDEEGTVLHGQSASPGCYEGAAHVILDPALDLELKPGEILVAPYTDPAWTPLFLTAGAAVVEVGSYLSHAGTVAREFGMPCVVDLPECTARIHTGFRLCVDGDRGVVRLIGKEEE